MNLTSLRLFSINSYGADLTKLQALINLAKEIAQFSWAFFWMNSKLENIKKIKVSKPLKLDCGKTINNFPLAYETYGK